jgi:penicillin amidase
VKITGRKKIALGFGLAISAAMGGGYFMLAGSLPRWPGQVALPGLTAPTQTALDAQGIPRITAQNREDAFRVLGYATARDRLFQMDLLRRNAAGRLAEVLGEAVLEVDIQHRRLGFAQVAEEAWARLPAEQRAVLTAYAAGVNAGARSLSVRPPELLALGYEFAPWRPEDSLLVVLAMAETLTWSVPEERMATVMAAALPPPLYGFLLPAVDQYTQRLSGQPPAAPPALPLAALSSTLRENRASGSRAGWVADPPPPRGSNGWVVGPAKARGGRALPANDMHLGLGVPNLWYRAELRYGATELTGFTLPGVPLLIAGSNGRIAWGYTSTHGDFADLVMLEMDPADASRYRTPQGYVRFGERVETIPVRGAAAHVLKVQETQWGPVLPEAVLGKPAALRWTALDPAATDLGLLAVAEASDVPAALAAFNRAGGPPLNALVADSGGHIGWTVSGRVPKRHGLDGLVSQSWADGSRGWAGYLSPAELPRRIDPPEGFIVNANQRMGLDLAEPHPVGNAFDNGHRAHRIAERLAGLRDADERDMLGLQLDTRAGMHRFYQDLALGLLRDDHPDEQRLKRLLERWDGHAEPDSIGFALLDAFRQRLLDAVVAPYLTRCRQLDPAFAYQWAAADDPLRQLLAAKPAELLPDPEHYRNWDDWLRAILLQEADRAAPIWGDANRVAIAHPLSAALPAALADWLDMPKRAVAGCSECVRAYRDSGGASERLVVAPGHEETGIFHMPGGQSGHPMSPHYRDQQAAWVAGEATPLKAGPAVRRVEFVPAAAGDRP